MGKEEIIHSTGKSNSTDLQFKAFIKPLLASSPSPVINTFKCIRETDIWTQ